MILAAALLSSCTTYYAVEYTIAAPVSEAASAMEAAVHYIPDLSLIADATPPTDSATLRYIGLQGVPLASGRLVRTMPKFAVRLGPEGTQSTVAVTSVGGDQYAKLLIVATEQELSHRQLVRADSSSPVTIGALPFKSSWLHQALNAVFPAAGMYYVSRNNPYTPPTSILDMGVVAATDIIGMYMIVKNSGTRPNGTEDNFLEKLFNNWTPRERHNQYQFVIGLVLCTILRYQFGMKGFLDVQQYNAIADSPYDLRSGFIDSRIQAIGISVKFP